MANSAWLNGEPEDWIREDPFPRDQMREPQLVAPAPYIDRTPIIIGQNLSGQYLSAAYRVGMTGWRFQFVDLINELLEHDPDSRGPVRQRVLAIAGARIEISPAQLPGGHEDAALAQQIAERFEFEFTTIPALRQALAQLAWGDIYGVSAAEIDWARSENGWDVRGLTNVHSRRLNYANPVTWDLYIYDQGPSIRGITNTVGPLGLRIADYPGKFIVHTPALNADYPTRDGEARYIGMYLLLKRMVVRATAQDFERTVRPWVLGYFNRDLQKSGLDHPIADDNDRQALDLAIKAIGSGSLNAATLPNSVRVELLRAAAAMSATEFIGFLNRAIAKALLGQAFTTEPGPNGNLATATVAKDITDEIAQYSCGCMSDTLERDLLLPWLLLNYPGVSRKLCPQLRLRPGKTDPEQIMALAESGAKLDMEVDRDWLAREVGLKLVNERNADRRVRVVSPGRGPTPPDPSELPAPDAARALNGKARTKAPELS